MEGPTRKRVRRPREEEPGVSNSNGTTRSDQNSCTRIDELHFYGISKIFQYLSMKDIKSAAVAYSPWSEVEKEKKRKRLESCHFVLFIHLNGPPNIKRTFLNYTNIVTIGQSNYMYNTKDTFLNFTNNMRIEPSVSFCFVSVFMLAGIDFIKDSFPPECEVIWLWGDCVAANVNPEVNPKREFLDVNVLCTFLPQIPNVEIKFFELLDVSTIKETHQYQDIINTIVKHKTSASNQETSSCFMLFCDFACYDVAQRWASAVQEGTENKVDSVCGGVLFRISTRNRLLLRCSAVLITGPIRTWSVILRMERGTTKEEVQTRLQSFKDKVNLKKYSIGFISVPVYSEKSNLVYVALKTFASLFPQTSLISYVSIDRNSFGKNTVDDVNEEKNDKDNDQFKKFKSWCTEGCFVFLLLTYG